MSKSRVMATVVIVLVFGVLVGIVATGLMNPAGAQDDLSGRRALLQKEGVDEAAPEALPLSDGAAVSGVAANESYLFVVSGGVIHQFAADSLVLVKQARVGSGRVGGPKVFTGTPTKRIRMESPSQPASAKMDTLDKGDEDEDGAEGGEGGPE